MKYLKKKFSLLLDWLFPPDYMIYTHRKGWMHISKATEQDLKEISGFGATPLPLD